MRKLIALTLIAATLYSGYWVLGRAQVQSRLTEALQQADDGPYDVRYASLRTRGFPSRFDTTITELTVADPATGTTWTAPFFQLFALAYRPNEVIALFPPEQTLGFGGQTYTILTADMRASGKVRPTAALAFQTATITLDAPRIQSSTGPELSMASALAAMRLTPETTQTYDAFIEGRAVVLPETTRRLLDPDNLLPAGVQSVRFDSDVTLSAPIELNGSGPAPQITGLTIAELAVTWGDIAMTAIGDVAPDATGQLAGSVTVTTRNWEKVIDLGLSNGMIDPDRRFLVTEIVRNLDETPHIDDTLTLSLTVANGQLSLGSFPIGSLNMMR